MNCFSHAYRFIDADPYFLVGTSIPDWLGMIDRKTRVRRERALPFADDVDATVSELARGIVQHHDDDKWFHESRAFAETHVAFTRQISRMLVNESSFRPHFVAHIAIEMLIDSGLTEIDRGRLDQYYRQIQEVDATRVEAIVNRIAPRSTTTLAGFMPRYVREGFLYDYLRNDGLAYRVNRILTAIGLTPLPTAFELWIEDARRTVRDSLDSFLQPPPDHPRFPLDQPRLWVASP